MAGKSRARFTAEQNELMRSLLESGMTSHQAAAAFQEATGRDMDAPRVYGWARRHGYSMADSGGRIRGSFWSEERDQWVRGFVPGHTEEECRAEFERVFGEPISTSQLANRRHALGVRHGTHGGRFKKGDGRGGVKSPEHLAKFLAAGERTRFKKGGKPATAVPMGSERVDGRDRRAYVKVREGREPGKPNTFELRSRVVWEQNFGPIPEGMFVRHRDGDGLNDDPANLMLVSRAANAYINGARRWGGIEATEENIETLAAIGEVRGAVNRARRERKHGGD